jgi:cysteinyl-tRNA synthetase
VLRFFLLGSHYRGPINYSLPQLEQADAALGRLYNALRGLPDAAAPAAASGYGLKFAAAMDDDFNTPEALAVLQTMAREINTLRAAGEDAAAAGIAADCRALAVPLGILQQDPESWFRGAQSGESGASPGLDDAGIESLVAARLAARKAKDFAESDRLRDALAARGVLLEDKPGGVTTWRRR